MASRVKENDDNEKTTGKKGHIIDDEVGVVTCDGKVAISSRQTRGDRSCCRR